MTPDMASAAHAVEANLLSFFKQLSGWPRIEVHDDADCFWTISDLPFPLFNSVMRAGASPEDVDALIDERIAACRSRRVPMLWWTGPSTQPDDLGRRLLARGFLFEPARGMVADLIPVIEEPCDGPPSDGPLLPVNIERVRDGSTLKTWTRVLCDAFGAPPPFGDAFAELALAIGLGDESTFHHFVACSQGEAVATSSLFLGGRAAGIYDVATVPDKRRLGIARAITQAAMQQARALGARTAILHSSPLGAGVYRSLGFRDVCDIGQYVWAPNSSQR